MAVRIRLSRCGRKNRPHYRIAVYDAQTRRDGRYLGVNRAWEAFFGVRREDMLGGDVGDLYRDAPQVGERGCETGIGLSEHGRLLARGHQRHGLAKRRLGLRGASLDQDHRAELVEHARAQDRIGNAGLRIQQAARDGARALSRPRSPRWPAPRSSART